MAIKAVLFDMDGVLLDSEGPGFDRLRNTLDHLQVHVSLQSLLERYTGMRTGEIHAHLIQEHSLGMTAEEFALRHRKISGSYYLDGDLKMMPGLVPLLQGLKRRGMQLAVVSSTASMKVLAALNRLSLLEYFSTVVCGDHVQQAKPAPEGYRMAADLLHAPPEECLVIEDSPLGIQAAKNAGMRVIGYRGTSHVQDTSGADLEISHFKELEEGSKLPE